MQNPFRLLFALFAGAALLGCATTQKMNRLSVGLTKQAVIKVMGEPASTSSPGNGVEILRYRLSPHNGFTTWQHATYGVTEEYFVRLVDSHVESFGKMGDFDSTKDPTLNINVKTK
jgi:hypothetical protein